MLQMLTKIVKWVSLPALLIASMFSRSASSYELLMDFVICLGAVIFVQRAVRLREYFWAAGLVAIAGGTRIPGSAGQLSIVPARCNVKF